MAAKYPTFPILLETTRECVNDVFDLPALREVLTDLRGRKVRVVAGRDAAGVAVRAVAAVRLDRRLHVRGRRAAGRAPGRRARARPRPAARPARRRGAARAASTPRCSPTSSSSCSAWSTAGGPATPTSSTTCCALLGPLTVEELDARCRRATPPVGLGRGAGSSERRAIARRRRRRGPVRRRRGRRPPARRARRRPPGRPARGVHRPGRRPARRPRRPLRPHPRPVPHRAGRRCPLRRQRRPGAAGARAARGRRARRAGRVPARRRTSASGATTTCCASCGAGRSPRCASEVEPVDAAALARFLPAWQGVGRDRRGIDALVEVLGQLQGAAIPASVLEADVLPARLPGYRPRRPRRSCAPPARSCGSAPAASARTTAGCGCSSATRPPLLVPDARPDAPAGEAHRAILEHLGQRGAVVLARPRRRLPAGRARPTTRPPCSPRCGTWCGPARSPTTRSRPLRVVPRQRRPGRSGAGPGVRPGRRPGRLARLGPPAGAGRWSLVAPLLRTDADAHRGGPRPGPPAARALRRAHPRGGARRGHRGRVRRRVPGAQGARGAGQVRRGYFVAGLGAAQFACPARSTASERLGRVEPRRDAARAMVLAATDPAQPYGAALPWPDVRRATRSPAGAHVVLVDGELVAYLERGGALAVHVRRDDRAPRLGRRCCRASCAGRPLPQPRDPQGRRRAGARVPGAPTSCEAAGFTDGYKGLVFRNEPARAARSV